MKINKFLTLVLLLFIGFVIPTSAQTVVTEDENVILNDEEEGEEDEEDGEDDEDDAPEVITGGIDVPESMETADDTGLDYNSRTYITEEGKTPAEGPSYEDIIYIERLRRMPTAIEMPYNDVVRKFIDRYTEKLRRSVSFMLGAQNFYMPIFEQALETYGLPLELKYLPVIESALKPKAVSRVGATGLWQFMLSTGKHYGLKVNSLVDERSDPEKASYAAAHYLRDLYRIFGDWHLVIAAYNCGPENVNKAIRRSGGEKDYWKIYPYLPSETRGYVPAFIAANYVMNYYCEHNITPMASMLPEKTDTIIVNRDVHFMQISHVLNIDIEQLRAINPQYRRDIVNGYSGEAILRLPQDYIDKFIDNQDSIYAYNSAELLKRSYVEVNDDVVTSTSHRSYTSYNKYNSRSRVQHGKNSRSSRDKYTDNKRGNGRNSKNANARKGRNDDRDDRNSKRSKKSRDNKDGKKSKNGKNSKDRKDSKGNKGSKKSKNGKDSNESKSSKKSKSNNDSKGSKNSKNSKGGKNAKDAKGSAKSGKQSSKSKGKKK